MYQEKVFEDIKKINEYGEVFWYARELQTILEYAEWRNFKLVIEKAKIACKGSKNSVSDHFVDFNKMVQVGSGAQRKIEDMMLSRYACYLKFRATQTDEKLRREQVESKGKANQTHLEVGKKVRKTIEELGGTMPEDLPTPKKSIRQIEKEQKKNLSEA